MVAPVLSLNEGDDMFGGVMVDGVQEEKVSCVARRRAARSAKGVTHLSLWCRPREPIVGILICCTKVLPSSHEVGGVSGEAQTSSKRAGASCNTTDSTRKRRGMPDEQ